jgi:ribosomal protein S18 acetylase RimI-like enzyme
MTDERVGHLWLFVPDSQFEKSGFIYDLEIVERFRRRGYAAAGMLALDEEARAWGLTRLSLHVFAHNTGAKALYDRLGYAVTGLGMTKQL